MDTYTDCDAHLDTYADYNDGACHVAHWDATVRDG